MSTFNNKTKSSPGDELVKMYRFWCAALPKRQHEILCPGLKYSEVVILEHKIKRLKKGINWFELHFGKSYRLNP